jgi:hypothetical protein
MSKEVFSAALVPCSSVDGSPKTPFVTVYKDGSRNVSCGDLDKKGYCKSVYGCHLVFTGEKQPKELKNAAPYLVNDKEVMIGGEERKLLEFLIKHCGEVFNVEQLYYGVWGKPSAYVSWGPAVELIYNLRQSTGLVSSKKEYYWTECPIRTVREKGYTLIPGTISRKE